MIQLRTSARGYTDLQQKLLGELKSNQARKEMNQIILDASQKYVPKITGNLRRSGHAMPSYIEWTAPYARYQHEGEVYGPNLPGWIGNKGVFRSPHTKYPTGRELGAHFAFAWLPAKFVWTKNGYRRASRTTPPVPVRFGYSTPGTKHHWFDEMWKRDSRSVNNKITRKLQSLLNRRRK